MKSVIVTSKGKVSLLKEQIPVEKKEHIIVKVHYSLISSGTERFIINREKRSFFKKIIEDYSTPQAKKGIKNFLKNNSIKTIVFLGIKTLIPKLGFLYDKCIQFSNYKTPSNFKPVHLGYSSSGIIHSVPPDLQHIFKKGEKVACAGKPHSEYISIPKNLTAKVPDDVSLIDASFTTIGCIAMQSVRLANIQLGDFVVIIGVGLVGQIVVNLAKVNGARVIAIDLTENKLNLAQQMGADYVINITKEDAFQKILNITNGNGVDISIVCASSQDSKPLKDAVEFIRKRGKVVLLGGVPLTLDRNEFYYKQAELYISTSYGYGRYDPNYEIKGFDYPFKFVRWTENRQMELFLKMLEYNRINVKKLVSKVYKIDDIAKAYDRIMNISSDTMGIILDFNGNKKTEIIQNSEISWKYIKTKIQEKTNPKTISIKVMYNSQLDFNEILSNTLKKLIFIMDNNPYEVYSINLKNYLIIFEDGTFSSLMFIQNQNFIETYENWEIFTGGGCIIINNDKEVSSFGYSDNLQRNFQEKNLALTIDDEELAEINRIILKICQFAQQSTTKGQPIKFY